MDRQRVRAHTLNRVGTAVKLRRPSEHLISHQLHHRGIVSLTVMKYQTIDFHTTEMDL